MHLKIFHKTRICKGKLNLTGSKSETNRLLILQAIFNGLEIVNKSNSDDSKYMQSALSSNSDIINIHHAGTAMRFLTAYYSQLDGREVVLTGSPRMKKRPIKILVDALRSIGASIIYENEEGDPPLRIKGKKLKGGEINLPAKVSSQYISALLMLGPILKSGIKLNLIGKITSVPYINMTLRILNNFGVKTDFKHQCIKVSYNPKPKKYVHIVESDWSSASYFFSIAALSDQAEIQLRSFKEKSLQGDSILTSIFNELGVNSYFDGNSLILKNEKRLLPKKIKWNLSNTPDIAQTLAVTCYGLGIGCDLEGLHTLKIKETDRLLALNTELSKLGAKISVTEKSLHLKSGNNFVKDSSIPTYEDHRMAMAFAPLALKTPLSIEDAGVVSKSYPSFWEDLEILDFSILQR